VADYAIELLIADTAAFADGLGRKRFHIVGRDWGAMVAWEFAATHPAQLLSLSALSTPDPDALFDAIANDEDQKLRSSTLRFSECPAMRPKLHCKQTIISAFVRHTKARFLRPPSGKMSVADQNRVIEFGAELVLGLGLRTANWKNSGADSLHLGLGGSGARRDRRPWYRGTCDGTVSFQETRRQITLARRGGS
jgi:pimeloyl-ACP methyl ester carboxylesterase